MDKLLNIKTEMIQTDNNHSYNNHRYEPSGYDRLKYLFKSLDIKEDDVLVDYGSGLGQINFVYEHLFNNKSVGIEYSEYYYNKALENKATYSGNSNNITFYNVSAIDYLVKKDETIFYFFNPFSLAVFRKVNNNIIASLKKDKRSVVLVMYYIDLEVERYLHNQGYFELAYEIDASVGNNENHREKFSVYKNTEDF